MRPATGISGGTGKWVKVGVPWGGDISNMVTMMMSVSPVPE